ncbi:hypothetical protein [Leifsonia sp. 1010]|uniref:hypothetical protein n=1 Tax=Leifsonia sp. 1010 TaxID=2817769 RepID=UPI0028542DD0|nr:hypothetical protein [Leifsonia sp. 1010]MDR6611581.1 ElaB/YqjD/DUF883 family membrane-anchored ribosome-binding protein [Leifsonia sp. 1010]
MTMSDDQSADTPIFDSRRDALEPEAGLPETVQPTGGSLSGDARSGGDLSGGASTGGQGGVRDEAGRVAGSAAEAGKDVAATAKEQAKNVAGEAKSQAKDLYRQTQEELRTQAAQQQERVASGLRSVGDELDQMASSSESGGLATDLVRQAAQRTHAIAGWLNERDPGSLLNEVKSYARRNPGTFIAAAAIAGALAGRLTRALASGGDDSGSTGSSTGTTGATTGTAGTTGLAPSPDVTGADTTGLGGVGTGTTAGGYGTATGDLYDDSGNDLPELPGAGYTGGRA